MDLSKPYKEDFSYLNERKDNYLDKKDTSERTDSFRRKGVNQTPERKESDKREGSFKEGHDTVKKVRDFRKEEIKAKISKLSEKLYSPSKIAVTEPVMRDRDDGALSFESRDSGKGRREYAHTKETEISVYNTTKADDLEEPPAKAPSRLYTTSTANANSNAYKDTISKLDLQNIEIKYKIIIQEHENTIFNLKSHISNLEKKNGDLSNKHREELLQVRENVFKEKGDVSNKQSAEIKFLNDKVIEFVFFLNIKDQGT